MDRSLFSQPSSSKRSVFSPSRHELPRWRSPSPMSASVVPPPIVQSTYASPAQPVAQSGLVEQPAPLQDRQSELEADLQYLLDAQAEGLVKGLEGGVPDDATSTGSTTPTARSVRSASGKRAGRLVRKKPGLRSARKGLYNTMMALSAVKDDELHAVADDLREHDDRISQIDEWERKKAGLQEAAHNVDANEDTVRVQRLRQQAETVEAEIRELERQLEDRRVLHRKLMRQVADVENAVQAKLASYTSSLRMLEEDVKRFLAVTPAQDRPSEAMNGDGRQSVWQLPAKRRTLELAREQYALDREAVAQHRRGVEREKDALDEGAAVWKDVVARVSEFERRMRDDMRVQAAEGQTQEEATGRLKELLGHMDELVTTLEGKLELARERNWNLLIAAIGAEVDALYRGKEMLEGVLGIEREERDGDGRGEDTLLPEQSSSANGKSERTGSLSSGGDEIYGLDKSFETARPLRRRLSDGGHSSEDDPDPELLFSQRDIDGE